MFGLHVDEVHTIKYFIQFINYYRFDMHNNIGYYLSTNVSRKIYDKNAFVC